MCYNSNNMNINIYLLKNKECYKMTKRQFISKYRNEVITSYIQQGYSRKEACKEYSLYKSWFKRCFINCFLEKTIPKISGEFGIIWNLYEWGPGYIWVDSINRF